MHYVRDCTYTKHVCRDCKQTGHKEGRKFLTVDINGSQVTLQLDIASDITIVSKKQWKKNLGSPTLTPTTRTARIASGDAFHLLGELRYPIKLGGVTKTATFYVTNNCINLIGLDWIELFKLWDTPLPATTSTLPMVNQVQVQERPRTLLEDEGPTLSQWAPIVVVKKPGGKVRICADYSTGLNAALEHNNYPLPVPDEIFTKLNGCRYFSVVDLSDAYLQVEVDDDSKQLLTINTHRGLFRFNRLAPGVKSAPGAFQQLMNSMVANLERVDTFLDDIFVASKTEEEHHKMLNALFQRLKVYGFVLREEKCNILQP
ncbi:uncharacterized protein K02A2.6-like [Armigeres subalbatus]|uniref:uncharacterized protein K02A2.6-like n=1 Tax=Armigeres subalbatus TaxID=124917 RepID=UPI002ECFBCBF